MNNKKIVISTDSTADLSRSIIDKYQIPVSSLHVLLGEKEYSDGVNISPEEIYNYVEANGVLPKTSATSVYEYTEFFSKLLEENDYIIHFNLSSDLSATHSNARLASEEFNGRVAVIDSRNLSTGQGLLVLKAWDLRKEGKSFEEIIDYIDKCRNNVQTSFVLDTVEYLHKGGRCSGIANFASKLFSLHPYIDMKDGKLSPKKLYRGDIKKCFAKYVKDLAEAYPDYDETRVFVTHACCPKDIYESVVSLVKEIFHFKEVLVTVAGSVISSHCGPGCLGVLFIKKA